MEELRSGMSRSLSLWRADFVRHWNGQNRVPTIWNQFWRTLLRAIIRISSLARQLGILIKRAAVSDVKDFLRGSSRYVSSIRMLPFTHRRGTRICIHC